MLYCYLAGKLFGTQKPICYFIDDHFSNLFSLGFQYYLLMCTFLCSFFLVTFWVSTNNTWFDCKWVSSLSENSWGSSTELVLFLHNIVSFIQQYKLQLFRVLLFFINFGLFLFFLQWIEELNQLVKFWNILRTFVLDY